MWSLKHHQPTALLTALILCFISVPADATHVRALTLDDLVDRAEVIARGTVIKTHVAHSPRNPGRIETTFQLRTQRVFKSRDSAKKKSTVLTFVLPGGELGRYGQFVSGVPRLTVGMEVVIFLRRLPSSPRLSVVGLAQGCFVVERYGARAPEAVSDRRGLVRLAPDSRGRLRPTKTQRLFERHRLDQLIDAIQRRRARVP